MDNHDPELRKMGEAFEEVSRQLAAANERAEKLEAALGVRGDVAVFAAAMESKLKLNDHKGGWSDCDKHWLMTRLYEEADELCDAVNRGVGTEIQGEAADVANFAMMIYVHARKALEVPDAL